MKKFKYRLERVLQYRKIVKDEKMRELMNRTHELEGAQQRLDALEQSQLNNSLATGALSDDLVLIAGLYSVRVKDEIAKQKVTIVEHQAKVQEAMDIYIEAAKEAKALSTLKERRLVEYKEYVAKEDEKFLDELVVQRSSRAGRPQH